MMPVVRIPDELFERLQNHAKPFVDTPASVIEKLLDFYEAGQRRAPRAPRSAPPEGPAAKRYDPGDPPDLTHTKVIAAEFDGIEASNWNELVDTAHRHAMKRLKTYDALRAATMSNIVRGKKTDSGFHYLSDIDVSVQGIDADLAWRNADHLARKLAVPVRVEFEWRDKPQAAHPGKRGLLEFIPSGR